MPQLTGRQKSRARRGAQALGIAAVATLLAGCSLASEVTAIFGTTDSTAVEWLTTPAGEPLWSADEQVFAGPIVVGNRVIAQVVADGALEVVAWDAENGEEVWSHPASTGAANPPKAWPLQIIQNDEGIPIVANLVPPTVRAVTLPDGTQGTVLQHRLNFIDVESGMAWGVSEPGHVYAARDCGFATAVCAQVLDVEQGLVDGAFPWKDVVIRYDGSSTPLLSDESYVSRMNIAPQLFVANRTDGGTSLLRFDGEQVRWDLDLAEVDLGGVPTARLAFGAGGSLEDGRSLMNVTLIDKGTPQTGVAEFRSTPVFMALDWQSGELLWHDRPVQADVGGLLKLGETSYVRNPGGSFDAVIDETTTLEHRDPLSGEPLWSLELADRESSVDALGAVLWSGDEHTVLLHSGGSWSAYDLEDGSLREPKDEEMFACYSRASSVLLPKASWPNGELAEYAAGSLAGGCLLDGVRITDPADWSRAAVALNSGFWTPHSDEFTDGNELYEEERYRVVSNEAGVHVYRF